LGWVWLVIHDVTGIVHVPVNRLALAELAFICGFSGAPEEAAPGQESEVAEEERDTGGESGGVGQRQAAGRTQNQAGVCRT